MAKIKDKERVLARLLELRNPETDTIYRPLHLLSTFRGLSEDEVYMILEDLKAEGVIQISTASDLDESDNIHVISFQPKAFFYLEEMQEHRKARRKDTRRYWLTTIIAIVGAITGVASLLWLILTTLYPQG